MDGIFADLDLDEAGEHIEIMSSLLSGFNTPSCAADRLASLVCPADPANGLTYIWAVVMCVVRNGTDGNREQVVRLLVHMANLPPVLGHDGRQLMVHDLRIWEEDMPRLGWEFRDEWNGTQLSDEPLENNVAISQFLNVNKSAALLFNSSAAVFADFDWFGLVTLRVALETPLADMHHKLDSPEAYIPAAAAWILNAGAKLYCLDTEMQYGGIHGDPGGGGPLWRGQHGFCPERWQLWRRRFGELCSSYTLSEGTRQMAKLAEDRVYNRM